MSFPSSNRTSGLGRKLLLAVSLLMLSFVALAPPASAQDFDPDVSMPCETPAELESRTGETTTAAEYRMNLLPLNRWSGTASNLHSRLGAGITDDVRQKLSRDVMQSSMMGLGDSIWQITAGMVTFASEYSVLDKAGCTADRSAATLGKAMLGIDKNGDQGMGAASLFAGAGIIVLFWKAQKSAENPAKKMVAMAATLGFMGVMLVGAMNTDETKQISPGSPAYLAIQVENIVTTVATAPAEAMNSNMPTAAAYGTTGETVNGDPFNCANYVAQLRKEYKEAPKGGSTAGAVLPTSLSAMWEQSGLSSYIQVQFGSKNTLGGATYCRQLERISGASFDEQWAILTEQDTGGKQISDLGKMDPKLIEYSSDNSIEDRAGIFWAICQFTGDGWDGRSAELADQGDVIDRCAEYYQDKKVSLATANLFDWDDSPSNIENNTEGKPGLRDFLFNWHGDAVTNGLAVSFIYVLSSGIIMIVFGLLSIGIVIAKTVGVVMIVLLFLMTTIALFPTEGSSNKLHKFLKFWLGMTVYAAALSFILSLVAIITAFVNQVGLETFGPGSLSSILWMGFAPVTAIIVLHVVFKHAVGIPSPFKPGSAMAYGGAVAGAGAAIGIGVDRAVRRGRGLGGSYARGMAERRGMSRKDRGGEKRGRGADQKMGPGGTAPAGTPAPGAGGAPDDGTPPPTTPPTTKTKKPTIRERIGSSYALGVRERARQAAQVPKAALGRMKDRWKADGGPKKMRRRAYKAAAVLAWSGIGGAATILSAPATLPIAGGIAAASLYRSRRNRRDRIATGETQTMRGATQSRTNQRVNEYRDHQLRRTREAAERAEAAARAGQPAGQPTTGPSGGPGGAPAKPKAKPRKSQP